MKAEPESVPGPAFWRKARALPAGSQCTLLETALTLYALLAHGHLSSLRKFILAGALAYFINPCDLIPDALPLGYTDDLTLLLAALKAFKGEVTPAIKAHVSKWLPPACQT